MKKVLSPDMVAHTWANQTQEEARNNGSTLFFELDKIYSYGRHFCIAKHVNSSVLFTTRRYSNTTAKHINIVRHASNHLNVIYCNDPSESVQFNLQKFESEIKSALHGLPKAKKPEKYINAAENIYLQVIKYTEFFKVEIPESIILLMNSAKSGKYTEYLQREAERIEKDKEELRLSLIERHKKEVLNWRKHKALNGKPSTGIRLWSRDGQDYLRLSKDKTKIQTSQGIEIPLNVAKRILNTINAIIKKGGCNGDCNFKILEFEVKQVNKEFIEVGCHKIYMTEIKSITKKLKW